MKKILGIIFFIFHLETMENVCLPPLFWLNNFTSWGFLDVFQMDGIKKNNWMYFYTFSGASNLDDCPPKVSIWVFFFEDFPVLETQLELILIRKSASFPTNTPRRKWTFSLLRKILNIATTSRRLTLSKVS